MSKKVNELDIRINKAIINRISVELNNESGKAEWSISGNMLTTSGSPISSFTFMSEAWTDRNKIGVPVSADVHARELFVIFQPIIMEKLQGLSKLLGNGKEQL